MEIKIYIIISLILCGSAHIFSAIKSGCFYAASRGEIPEQLEKFIKNLHRVQTPFWYSLFGSLFFMILAIGRIEQDSHILQALLDYSFFYVVFASYLITQGISSLLGVFYQGWVNIGSGKPFIDHNEKRKFEIASPFSKRSIWLNKFWYGKNRIWISFVGLFMIIFGLYLLF